MSGDSVDNAGDFPITPGYFGKIPSRGDFLSFGLPREFLDPWDDWVQTALEQSRERFSDQWLDFYLTSPLWCFSIGAGICGGQSWTGMLMPSVDGVGRYFPLTIAAPLDPKINVLSVFNVAGGWFERVEQLARSALDDDFDLDRFGDEIRQLALPDGLLAPGSGGDPPSTANALSNAWR
jgi:type VI secretion system protein ImpM